MTRLLVRVGGLLFRGQMGREEEGFLISPDGWEGWDDGVDVRLNQTDRPQGLGSFPSRGFLSSRVLSISGQCIADTQESLASFRNRLTGLLAGGGSARVYVDHQGETLWSIGALQSKPSFAVRAATPTIADYQLQLWFPDPRKFGRSQTFPLDGAASTGVNSWHYGNFEASPVITVTGSAPQYTINGPTGYYIVNRALVSGHPHVIDLFTGSLSIDGARVFGATLRADTWTVPAGEQIYQTITPTSGTAVMRIAVPDTYV